MENDGVAMTLDMHALTLYRLAMKKPEMRHALLPIAAALQRGALKVERANRRGPGGDDGPGAA